MDRAQLNRKIIDETVAGKAGSIGHRCRSVPELGMADQPHRVRILLSTGAQINTVELAEDLAAQVQRFLTVRMLSGPAVALPGAPRRWLLLAGGADETPQAMIDRLDGRGGVTHRCGHWCRCHSAGWPAGRSLAGAPRAGLSVVAEDLRLSRAGTIINVTSGVQESVLGQALIRVVARVIKDFDVKLAHDRRWLLRDLVRDLSRDFPDVDFYIPGGRSFVSPDGGILTLVDEQARKHIILITEVKNQGTNDLRAAEGKKSRA